MQVDELKLRFFNIGVRLHSDSSSFVDFMARMYPRFLVADFEPPLLPVLEFHFYHQSENPWGKPVFISEGEIWPLHGQLNPEGYVYDSILNTVLGRVRNYLLIHAGVLSRDGLALLLAADSGHGKTTLVLELVKRGYRFLSDELAPICRMDHRVEPFPRSLRLRPGTLELAGLPPAPADTPLWFGKHILDIDQIIPGAMGMPSRIAIVIILQEQFKDRFDEPETEEKELGVFVNWLDLELLAAVGRFEGVTDVWQSVELGYPVLRLRAARRMQVLAEVEKLCRAKGILIVDVSKRSLTQPSFTEPARLAPLQKSQAALELIRQYQPAHKSTLLQQEYKGSSTGLFLELVDVLEQADCYQLKPGPLSETADLICGLKVQGG